ncbi:MAG: transcription antitermination factor NusB [Chlamydiota bacterium]
MATSQRKIREIVFQIIYSRSFSKSSNEGLLSLVVKKLKVSKKSARLALEKALTIEKCFPEIDEKMAAYLDTYKVEQLSTVEKNVLRLGLFELFYDEAIPKEVAIAEAIRLCRKFGSIEGAKFVNAILDGSYKHHQKQAS